MMELQSFQDLLDGCGAELSRWPADDRNEAEDLLARSAEARLALDQARAFETRLGAAFAAGQASPDLMARLAAIPMASRQAPAPTVAGAASGWRLFLTPFRLGAAAVAASLLLGLISDPAPLQSLAATDYEEAGPLAYALPVNLEVME